MKLRLSIKPCLFRSSHQEICEEHMRKFHGMRGRAEFAVMQKIQLKGFRPLLTHLEIWRWHLRNS